MGLIQHSPVSILVKRFRRREPQHAADDAAAAQVPTAAAHVTPLPRMLHFQHSFRDQTAAVSGEHGPQASLLQVNRSLSVRNRTSFNKRGCFGALIEPTILPSAAISIRHAQYNRIYLPK